MSYVIEENSRTWKVLDTEYMPSALTFYPDPRQQQP